MGGVAWWCRRDRALAAIKLAPEDVALVAQELDLAPDEAGRRLREAGGDVYVRHPVGGCVWEAWEASWVCVWSLRWGGGGQV